jgi:hypothetical protein
VEDCPIIPPLRLLDPGGVGIIVVGEGRWASFLPDRQAETMAGRRPHMACHNNNGKGFKEHICCI